MEENEPRITPNNQSDPWEEEIDLRELVRGIAKKWYIWLVLPFLAMVLVAGYLYLTVTPSYILNAGFYYDDLTFDTGPARRLLPSKDPLTSRLKRVSTYDPLFAEIFSDVLEISDEDDLSRVFQRMLRDNAEFTISEDSVFLEFQTSYPELGTEFIERYFDLVMETEAERILNNRRRRLEHLQSSLQQTLRQRDKWRGGIDEHINGDSDELMENGGEAEPLEGGLKRRFRQSRELLPLELEILQQNQEFLSRILNLDQRIYELEHFSEDSEEYFEYYPPGEPQEQPLSRRRDTLLAGAVTFLLALFGTAFWEII